MYTRPHPTRGHAPRTPHRLGAFFVLSALVAPALLTLMGACASTPRYRRSPPSLPSLGAKHPLHEKIYDVAGRNFIEAKELRARLSKAQFVLLGEKHTNPRHHVIQADLLRAAIGTRQQPAVAWEMITTDESLDMQEYLSSPHLNAWGIGPSVRWEERGWPAWAGYLSIAEAAFAARLPWIAAGLGSEDARLASTDGVAGLKSGRARDLGVGRPLPEPLAAAQAKDVENSHCGYANDAMTSAMMAVQQTKDGFMALQLWKAAAEHGAVILIAGNEHVRRDRGVPHFLLQHTDVAKPDIVVVQNLEVVEARNAPRQYLDTLEGFDAPADYVWFTARDSDEDPCEEFREQLAKMKAAHQEEGAQ